MRDSQSRSQIEIRAVAGGIGAEIGNVDVSRDLDEGTIGDIRRALLEHCVIFFRNQDLSAQRQKAFTRRFGEIFIHPNYRGMQEDAEILLITREPGDARIVGEEWHADATMLPQPPMGAILYAMEVPPYGGDTLFANQYLAYEALSVGMKNMLAGLRGLHSDRKVAGPGANRNAERSTKVREDADWRETISAHPVVVTHPETGRKLLYVNRSYTVGIEGMTEEENAPLLQFLLDHGNRPEFTCRFRWERGSIAFWDNRSCKHLAVHDAGGFRRVMRRTQIRGGPLHCIAPRTALSCNAGTHSTEAKPPGTAPQRPAACGRAMACGDGRKRRPRRSVQPHRAGWARANRQARANLPFPSAESGRRPPCPKMMQCSRKR